MVLSGTHIRSVSPLFMEMGIKQKKICGCVVFFFFFFFFFLGGGGALLTPTTIPSIYLLSSIKCNLFILQVGHSN